MTSSLIFNIGAILASFLRTIIGYIHTLDVDLVNFIFSDLLSVLLLRSLLQRRELGVQQCVASIDVATK
jgi:hypothetical protein